MGYTLAALDTAALDVAGQGVYISVHVDDPGSTGANESSGGSPAYARQQTTWSAGAGSDGIAEGSQVTFDLPAGTYTHIGIWTDVTGGTFIASQAVTAVVLGSQGQLLVTPKVKVS